MKDPVPTAWTVVLEPERKPPSLAGTALAAALVISSGLGGFGAWAWTARLDRGAVAHGTIVVDSHRKTISHLEGGILRELLVQNGDLVQAGQALLRLDGTRVEAARRQVQNQYWTAMARHARLQAEQADQLSVTFPEELRRRTDDIVPDILAAEERLFITRRNAYDGATAVQRQQIVQLEAQIIALRAQNDSTDERLALTEEELRTVKELLGKGYETRTRLMELQRAAAELRGDRSNLSGAIAQAKEGIVSARLQIASHRSDRYADISRDIAESKAQITDAAARLRGMDDILQRLEIVAPQAGKVTDIKFFTPGSVIPAGVGILDLVPVNDDKIVAAQVDPKDIDTVRVGQPAQVRLLAYKQRTVPMIDGHVTYVSADQSVDPVTNLPYFAAYVKLDPAALSGRPEVELYPGMPAEIVVVAGERLAIDYFTAPFRNSLWRAFREE